MSDTQKRLAERNAATGDPEAEAWLSREKCRRGEHEWREGAKITDFGEYVNIDICIECGMQRPATTWMGEPLDY